ncbi:MAG TPA: hypothetical protein VG370_02270 [Chloroflexota bacterium]|nr:hypothetical protein [Chloroflexota bacterium]
MLILDLEIEHLARARQHGLEREAAIALLLRRAAAQARRPEEEPRRAHRDEVGLAARFLAKLAPHT